MDFKHSTYLLAKHIRIPQIKGLTYQEIVYFMHNNKIERIRHPKPRKEDALT